MAKKAKIQTITREVDIPDLNKKGLPKVELPPHIAAERKIRRYIKKDGLFKKGLEQLFDVDTDRRDENGNAIRRPSKTVEQAEAFVTKLCKASGRKVETTDTGRKKAVPGWDLSISVPGMKSSEAKAVKEPEGKARQELADRALVNLQKENAELKDTVKELAANVKELLKKK